MNTSRSEQLYKTACGFMPGGVNSPVRACKAVGTVPLFIDHAKGSRIWDEDGNEFIDYVCSWGPNILGHCCEPVINAVKAACDKRLTFGGCHKGEITSAELIKKHFPSMEMLRLVNSGTEADEMLKEKHAYVEPSSPNIAADPVVQYMSKAQMEKSIERTRKLMQEAAKKLEFIEAAQYRNELLKLEDLMKEKWG